MEWCGHWSSARTTRTTTVSSGLTTTASGTCDPSSNQPIKIVAGAAILGGGLLTALVTWGLLELAG